MYVNVCMYDTNFKTSKVQITSKLILHFKKICWQQQENFAQPANNVQINNNLDICC